MLGQKEKTPPNDMQGKGEEERKGEEDWRVGVSFNEQAERMFQLQLSLKTQNYNYA